jgi:hypothetical protein
MLGANRIVKVCAVVGSTATPALFGDLLSNVL